MAHGYSETVLDHYERPRNRGALDSPDAEAAQVNPVCGDTLHLMLQVRDGQIREIRYEVQGCTAAVAAASLASELLRGRSLADAAALSSQQLTEALGGLPPSKLHASLLLVQTLRQALQGYRSTSG